MALDLTDKSSGGNNLTEDTSVGEYTTSLPFANCNISADMDGDNGFYTDDPVNAASALTLEFWVNFDSGNGNLYFFRKWTSNLDWFLRWLSDNRIGFRVYNSGGANDEWYWNWTPTAGTWYHIAVTWDGSTKTAELFINGSSQGSSAKSNVATIRNQGDALYIGNSHDDFGLNGKMTDIRIWSDVRTSTEINNNKDDHLAGNEAGLIGYWPFEAVGGGGSAPIPTTDLNLTSKMWG